MESLPSSVPPPPQQPASGEPRAGEPTQTGRSVWHRMCDMLRHWYGIMMTLAVAVSALWLVATGQHTLYIHPRYTIFIIEMSAIALAACLWAIWRGLPETPPDVLTHDTLSPDACVPDAALSDVSSLGATTGEDATPTRRDTEAARPGSPRPWQRRLTSTTTVLLVTAASVMVLLVPPAPLSPSMAAQRGGGRATSTTFGTIVRHLADLPEQPRISDWAMLLVSQTKDNLTGVPAAVEGFVTTRPEIADSGYYLVRFTIVCCAVDAFPASIPIYDPHWRDHVEVGQWLQVEGTFQPSNADIHEQYMLHPTQVTPIPEPDQPYLF